MTTLKDRQEYKGQMLGTNTKKETIYVVVCEDGVIANDNSALNESIPKTIIGNTVNENIFATPENSRIYLKGITIYCEGTGTVKLKRISNDETILPLYGTNFNRGTVSSALNLKFEEGDGVYAVISDMNSTQETFIGVSYRKIILD